MKTMTDAELNPYDIKTEEQIFQPLIWSSKRLQDGDLELYVADRRTDAVHKFSFSHMLRYMRNLPDKDEHWSKLYKDICRYNDRFKDVKTEDKGNIKIEYVLLKRYGKDGEKGEVLVKYIEKEQVNVAFRKEITANSDTKNGIYWIHKDVYLDLCKSNINEIVFHINGLEGDRTNVAFPILKESNFFDLDDFTNFGIYKGDKIYINEKDLGNEPKFKDNKIKEWQ